jgi:signal transduction histidine kinase
MRRDVTDEELRALPRPAEAEVRRQDALEQRDAQMQSLLVQSGVALGIMAIVSVGLGWLMAGRVLRPLRTMTTATRRISEHSLDQRLALTGPRDELKDLGDTIDELLGRLEAAFLAQRRFVANASHELRTPLAMMRTSLDVATGKPGAVAPEVRVLEGKLREGLDRADGLLESFLVLARAQHGALPEQTAVSLPELVAVAIGDRRAAIADREIAVVSDLGPASAQGSPTLLARMVENVIDNAVRHNDPWGRLHVRTSSSAGTSLLEVETDGPRLGDDDVARLAEPFRRMGADRTGGDGVGLGLSIVAAIAAAHDGALTLAARSEGGLRVAIELPEPACPARPALPTTLTLPR